MPLGPMPLHLRSLAVAGCLWALAGPALAQTPPPVPPPTPVPAVPHIAPLPRLPQPAQQFRFPRSTELRLRDLAAIVVVRPENRADIAVAIVNTGPLPAPEARSAGRRVTIDGKLRRRIEGCRASGDRFQVSINRVGRVDSSQLPTVIVRTPQNVVISGGGAVRLHVGRAEDVTVRLEGCGQADLESVEGAADISASGDIDIRAYDTGEASVRVSGDGEVVLGVVREGLAASIAGGDLTAARVDGDTNIAIQGDGDVTIRAGRADNLSVVIAGKGDFTHGGSAESLDAVIIGSGDVRVRRVDGEINRRIFGSGDVQVGGAAPP